MSVAILPMGEQYAYTDMTKGLIASAFSLGYCLGLLPAGLASSATSPKLVLGSGLLLWSIAQALTPLAADSGVSPLLATRALMGVGEAAAIPSIQVIAANFVSARSRSQFWGILTSSLSLGTIGAYTFTPPLVAGSGWPSAFFVYGGAGVLLSAVWLLLGRDEPRSPIDCLPDACEVGDDGVTVRLPPTFPDRLELRTGSAAEGSGGPLAELAARVGQVPWSQMASSRPIWALAAAHSASNFFLYFALSWLPTYFAYEFGLSTAGASAASQLPFVAAAIASVSAGGVCDALVARANLPLTTSRKLMQGVACVGPMMAMVALTLLGTGAVDATLDQQLAERLFIGALAAQAFSAAGFGCAAQDISRRYSSLIYGGTSAISVVVGAAGQYLTGAVLEQSGRDFTLMFAATALVELAGVVAWTRWWRSERIFD